MLGKSRYYLLHEFEIIACKCSTDIDELEIKYIKSSKFGLKRHFS